MRKEVCVLRGSRAPMARFMNNTALFILFYFLCFGVLFSRGVSLRLCITLSLPVAGLLLLFVRWVAEKVRLRKTPARLAKRKREMMMLRLLCMPKKEATRELMDCLMKACDLTDVTMHGFNASAYLGGKKFCFFFANTAPGEHTSAQDVLACARLATACAAQEGVLLSFSPLSPAATASLGLWNVPLRVLDEQALLPLLDISNITDEETVSPPLPTTSLFAIMRAALSRKRTWRYFLYGAGLMALYAFMKFPYALIPGLLCLLLAVLSAVKRKAPPLLS